MSEDLQSLLEKINRDGVEKAKAEAARIIAEAKAKADALIREVSSGDRSLVLPARPNAGQLNAIAKCIRICGNAGLESAGMEPDLTDKWVLKAMRPAQITEAMSACMNAINEGMASEIPKNKEGGPVDVTLEKIEEKKERDG